MKKLWAACLMLAATHLHAQSVFYYGKDSVTAEEFMRAFHKNNADHRNEKAFREYLDLYINSRLKIAEAKRLRYDTLPQLKADLDNLRQQIMPNYLVDKESMNRMIDEVFTRQQKDVHIAHIFIDARNGADVAEKKLKDVQAALQAGTPFNEVASRYSDDPAAKANGGDLGFITVFILPYELENLAYQTPKGTYSQPFRSKAGYHIFMNREERPALGRMKASQILIAYPPESTEAQKQAAKHLADSLYQRIKAGDNFGQLAARFSNDVISSASNGKMQEFGIGQYDARFEQHAFALAKDDDITAPFETAHGWHIVKREARVPVPKEKTEQETAMIRQGIEESDRAAAIKAMLAKKVLKDLGYKKLLTDDAAFFEYSDSVLNGRKVNHSRFTGNTLVMRMGKKDFPSSDWIGYAQTFRYKSDGSGLKKYPQLWDEFVEAKALQYYQDHLEDYSPEFRNQLKEFKEGNLFFEVMQRKVWGPAQNDTLALEHYFNANKAKYNWKQSADAVMFYATDLESASKMAALLSAAPSRWRQLSDSLSDKIAADSSRFDITQLPNPTFKTPAPGVVLGPQLNTADNTATLALVIRYYPQSEARSFAQAKGLVINDYQAEIEKKWLASLRQRYPVRVNQKVVDALAKKSF